MATTRHEIVWCISSHARAPESPGFELAADSLPADAGCVLDARERSAQTTQGSEQLDVQFVELDVTRMETMSAAAARIEADFGKPR